MLITKVNNSWQHVFIEQAVPHPFADDGVDFLWEDDIFSAFIENYKIGGEKLEAHFSSLF